LTLLVRGVTQGVRQPLLHRSQLRAKAIELFVLGAGGITLLRQHGLLKQTNVRCQLLLGATSTASQLVTELALQLIATLPQLLTQVGPQLQHRFVVLTLRAQGQP
jgi:hypothetical protein